MSVYLFTIVFIALVLLFTDATPQTQPAFVISEPRYAVIEACEIYEPVTFVVKPTPAPAVVVEEPSQASATDITETIINTRAQEISKTMTKKDILNEIKRHGYYLPNAAKMTKAELSQALASRQKN